MNFEHVFLGMYLSFKLGQTRALLGSAPCPQEVHGEDELEEQRPFPGIWGTLVGLINTTLGVSATSTEGYIFPHVTHSFPPTPNTHPDIFCKEHSITG